VFTKDIRLILKLISLNKQNMLFLTKKYYDIAMTLEDNSLISPKARAIRLKEAREVAGLTLKEMSSTGLINFNTLCGWETAKHGGLTERGALLVVKRLDECATECSVEWLLYAQGDKPKKKLSINKGPISKWVSSLHKLIINAHPSLLYMQVTDSSMTPEYNIGDYVYGFSLSPDIHQLSSVSGKPVIVQQELGNLALRKLIVNQISNEILLTSYNHNFYPPFLYNPTIEIIATVMCHIRNDGIIIQ